MIKLRTILIPLHFSFHLENLLRSFNIKRDKLPGHDSALYSQREKYTRNNVKRFVILYLISKFLY